MDVLAFVTGFLVLVYTFLWAGLTWWAVFWVGVLLWLGVVELYLEKTTGRTLSERFGELRARKPWKAWVVLGVFWLAIIALTWHLLSMKG